MKRENIERNGEFETVSVTFVKPFDDKYDLKETAVRLSILHDCYQKARQELGEEGRYGNCKEELVSVSTGCIGISFILNAILKKLFGIELKNKFHINADIKSRKQKNKGITINIDNITVNNNVIQFNNFVSNAEENRFLIIEAPMLRKNQKYSLEDTAQVCDKFIQLFVKGRSNLSLDEFVDGLELLNHSKGSLKVLALNIVWLLNSRNIGNQFQNVEGKPNVSKLAKFVLEVLLYQYGIVKY